MINPYDDTWFMKQAMLEAEKAQAEDEVPIGAVIVCGSHIIARGYNQTEKLCDVTAHAEMLCLTAAANHLGSKYLKECTLFVTCEPCMMCAGAIAWAQLGRLVWGAPDDRKGFMRYGREILHPKTQTAFGILMDDASLMLKKFFAEKRRLNI